MTWGRGGQGKVEISNNNNNKVVQGRSVVDLSHICFKLLTTLTRRESSLNITNACTLMAGAISDHHLMVAVARIVLQLLMLPHQHYCIGNSLRSYYLMLLMG